MELKAIRSEMISRDLRMSKIWYERAQKSDDRWFQEYYSNRALFGDARTAKQETSKYFQKEMRSGTILVDSARVISTSGGSNDDPSVEDGNSETQLIAADTSGFVSENVSPVRVKEIFELLVEIIETKLDRQLIAFFLWESGFSKNLDDAQYEVFRADFEILASCTKSANRDNPNGKTNKFNYQRKIGVSQHTFVKEMWDMTLTLRNLFR